MRIGKEVEEVLRRRPAADPALTVPACPFDTAQGRECQIALALNPDN